jgi:phosphate transport system protein
MKHRKAQAVQSTSELSALVLQACLVAKDAAFNVRDFIENSSNLALLAVKDCEKELDRMERRVDEKITGAITQVSETEARELLACLKFIIDLERIGDLVWSAAQRLHNLGARLLRDDSRDLIFMAEVLEKMLQVVHQGFVRRDLDSATWVMQADSQIDHVYHGVFRRHLANRDQRRRDYSTSLLLMAQAFERAGDHAKNLGEELVHLVEGRSVRHEPKRPRSRRPVSANLGKRKSGADDRT